MSKKYNQCSDNLISYLVKNNIFINALSVKEVNDFLLNIKINDFKNENLNMEWFMTGTNIYIFTDSYFRNQIEFNLKSKLCFGIAINFYDEFEFYLGMWNVCFKRDLII